MATLSELITGRDVYTVEGASTVLDVARFMAERNIGAVAVMRGEELIGIISERDIMKRVVAGSRSPGSTMVSEVMTPRPHTVSKDDTYENCMFLMREHGFRHLPIMDGKKVVGLISLRDILLRNLSEKDDEVKHMRSYISGEA